MSGRKDWVDLEANAWGVLWRSRGRDRGLRCHPIRDRHTHTPILFKTKAAAQRWIKQNFGYIASRRDLRNAPHYWRMPVAVRVKLSYEASYDSL